MLKVFHALHPTFHFLARAQFLALWKKNLPQATRNQFLRSWGEETLKNMHVELKVRGKPIDEPCLFVGNHISYLDIPVVCTQMPALFLAKKEISYWPLIGNAARLVNTVFVDRKSSTSRQESAERVLKKVQIDKERFVIFPSGTTSVDEQVPWRMGAFRLAAEHKIPIQAFRIRYKPTSSAFIGEDLFLPHMYQLLKHPKIEASIEFRASKIISDPKVEMDKVKRWCMS